MPVSMSTTKERDVEITLIMEEEFDMVACNNEHNG